MLSCDILTTLFLLIFILIDERIILVTNGKLDLDQNWTKRKRPHNQYIISNTPQTSDEAHLPADVLTTLFCKIFYLAIIIVSEIPILFKLGIGC